MSMDRELFIQQLVTALQENTTLCGGVSSVLSSSPPSGDSIEGDSSSESAVEGEKSPIEFTGLFLSSAFSFSSSDSKRLAQDVYLQLQFDFPQVQDASIEALAELYRRLADDKSTGPQAVEFSITTKLLDNVAFLNDQNSLSKGNKSRSSEASGLLAASLLLLVFRSCLETPKDERVAALLSSLKMNQLQQVEEKENKSTDKLISHKKKEEKDIYVGKFAAQEDPDDLRQVYEGQLPKSESYLIPMWTSQTASSSKMSIVDKLQYLSSFTFSSSFDAISMEKWEQWRLDDELITIIRLLQHQTPENIEKLQQNGETDDDLRSEWSRYLYVLRDRVLRFPASSRNSLWKLKQLMEFFHSQKTESANSRTQKPQFLVYRVLAELAISHEFHQAAAQRAQQGLVLVIQELLPFIMQEIHQFPVLNTGTRYQTNTGITESANAEDDELVVVFLQLLHFMLFASTNTRTTTAKLHESGILRTFLSLLPPKDSKQGQKRWLSALLRLLAECALWHPDFARYIVRVPTFVQLVPVLKERFVVEELLFALAFHQHQIPTANTDMWTVFTSESVFPQHCESYLDAMKKLQNVVFLLDCFEKSLPVLRVAVQNELQSNLQHIYARFTQSFEYPTFTASNTAQVVQKPLEDEKKEKEDQSEAEMLQFTALRNKLRQNIKSILTADSSGGRTSSKLD